MNPEASKVTPDHLRRDAYLYVRQSSLHQVVENTERQYALRQRAVALGWPADRVIVNDEDLGQSASGVTHRAGFERLVTEVGTGRAGIVLGLEVSRLARSSTEWHRLLEILFFRPDGEPFPAVPRAPAVPPDAPLADLVRRNRSRGVEPDAWTATPRLTPGAHWDSQGPPAAG